LKNIFIYKIPERFVLHAMQLSCI